MKGNLLRLFIICVMSIFTLGASAIRGGETPDKNYLCFTANEAGSTVALVKSGNSTALNIAYSIDGMTWSDYTFGTVITLNDAGDKVYFRNADEGVASGFSISTLNRYFFSMSGSIAASGNVMSLIDQSCKATEIPDNDDYCFCDLFMGCRALTSAPELPATKLTNYCYENMFLGCTNLTSAPELPAITLAENCYLSMFNGCTSLTSAPELPATTLATYCYSSMFSGCTSLTSAPELPATTLADYCYVSMFQNCTGLTSAPELPAMILVTGSYNTMFKGCTGLKTVSVAWDDGKTRNTKEWLNEVSSTGTFICPTKLDLGIGQIPWEWTVKNTYDLTITDAGWASMCVNLPLEIPEGVEVYYASAVEGSTISLTQIEAGTTITPRTAVLVKGTGTVSFPIIAAAGTAYTSNLFAGTSADKAKKENVYVLSGVGSTGNPQFQNYTGTTLGAHKIWLPASAVGGSNAKELRFVFENEETGIHSINVNDNDNENMYNLNGVRVNDGYKGIVIVNGKKVIKK